MQDIDEIISIFDNESEKNKLLNKFIFYSIKNNDSKTMQLLINKGLDLCIHGQNALNDSVNIGCVDIAKILIENGVDVNLVHLYNLKLNIKNGCFEMVKLLIDNVYNIDSIVDKLLKTSIKYNCSNIIKLLIKNGANFNKFPNLLEKSLANGDLEMVNFLIRNNVDTSMIKDPIDNKIIDYFINKNNLVN